MQADPTTRERLHLQFRLRDDVFVWPDTYGGKTWYHLELKERGRFFRVGLPEYTFLSLLDGETSLGAAISLAARALGPDALSADQVNALLKWLQDSELVVSVDDDSVAKPDSQPQLGKLADRLNPFWMKVPLINPDRLVERLLPWLSWTQSVPAGLVAVLLWIAAAFCLMGRWSEFTLSSQSVLSPSNWLYLTGAWIGLKVAHETSHAIACRRHGGAVRETGVIFILLAPVAYVDVTSSLRFRSKWQRIQTAAAGMFAELTIASLAVFAWSHVQAPELRHLLFNVIFMASLTTLLFNANPLMKFDGYYMLSDLLEIPNLAASGQQACQILTRRWCLGLPTPPLRESGLRARLISLYGLASAAWRVLVCLGLTITAAVLWHGLGVVLAIGCVAAWLGRPVRSWWRNGLNLRVSDPRLFRRSAYRVAGLSTVAAATLAFAPWPFPRTAPGFVEYRDLAVLRADSPGFVKSILVADGELVEVGQLLIQLENHELETDVADLTAALEQSEVRRDRAIGEQNTAAAQIEEENYAAIVKRLAEKRRHFESLAVRAPIAGRVMSRSLKWMLDTYATTGTELVTVGNEAQKEFRASLAQTDADSLRAAPQVALQIPATGWARLELRRINPRASLVPPHPALVSAVGGPLAVREIPPERQRNGEHFELTEPRVTADFPLDSDFAAQLPSGTTGTVTLSSRAYSSLGTGLYWTIHKRVDQQLQVALRENP